MVRATPRPASGGRRGMSARHAWPQWGAGIQSFPMKLENRVALITGGGRGIGRSVALAFAREGARVAVASRTREHVEAVAKEICAGGGAALLLVCDVANPQSVRDAVAAVVQQWNRLDILVNNAGTVERVKILDCDDATWNNTIAVNLNGTFFCTRAALPHMLQAGWGRIINVASVAARHATPFAPAYTASKHGVLGFTRCVALEFATRGITANAICPGWVDTDMADAAVRQIVAKTGRTREQARQALEQMSPQKRMAQPEEIAALAVLLASEAGGAINGQGINVDGGSVMS